MGGIKINPFGTGASRTDAFSVHPEHLIIIGLDTDDGPEHPLYDERIKLPLDEKMVLNIAALGVQVPVLTQKLDDGRIVVLDGRQRVRHAREANARAARAGGEWMRVPVAAPKRADTGRAVSVMISANEFRTDDDVVTKAKKARRLQEDFGMKPAEIATLYKVSDQAVRGWLKLGEADDSLLEQVQAGAISATAAGHMAALPQEAQKVKAAEIKEKAKTAPKSKNGKSKKVTVKSARTEAKVTKAPEGDFIEPPSRRVLRKLVEDGKASGINEDFLKGVAFCLGEMRPDRVAGLKAFTEEAIMTKAEKKAEEKNGKLEKKLYA